MLTFRKFMEDATAAPTMGASPSPPAPGAMPSGEDTKPNPKDNLNIAFRELGIRQKDRKDALKEPILMADPIKRPGMPLASAPIPMFVDDLAKDGSAKTRLDFPDTNQDKLMNPHGGAWGKPQGMTSLWLPPNKKVSPDGNMQSLANIFLRPIKNAGSPGAAPPMPGGGPGGML